MSIRCRLSLATATRPEIAYFPNFFRWFDASTFHFFRQCGLPPWHELEKAHGVIGFPVVDVSCQFRRPARVGDRLEVRTTLEEWRDKSFVIKHELLRGEERLAEAREDPRFCPAGSRRSLEDQGRIGSGADSEDDELTPPPRLIAWKRKSSSPAGKSADGASPSSP
jgi:4-hydroxybenzoyl-CoA thioesterase